MSLDSVLWEEPAVLAVVNQDHLNECCAYCFQRPSKFALTQCVSCKVLFYCSERCQRKDWVLHQTECTLFQVINRVPFTLMRLMARMLIKIKQDPSFLHKIPWEYVDIPSIDSDLRLHFQQTAALLYSLIPFGLPSNLSIDDCVKLNIMLKTHSFSPEDVDGFAPGLFFYLNACHLNHACSPNAEYSRIGRNLRIVSVNDIASGQEVTVSYIKAHSCEDDVQKYLKSQFFFVCQCLACTNPNGTEKLSEFFQAMKNDQLDLIDKLKFVISSQLDSVAMEACLAELLPALMENTRMDVANTVIILLLDQDCKLRVDSSGASTRILFLMCAARMCSLVGREADAAALIHQAEAMRTILYRPRPKENINS